MKAIICDRCGEVVKGYATEYVRKLTSKDIDDDTACEYEICESCKVKFDTWMKGENK